MNPTLTTKNEIVATVTFRGCILKGDENCSLNKGEVMEYLETNLLPNLGLSIFGRRLLKPGNDKFDQETQEIEITEYLLTMNTSDEIELLRKVNELQSIPIKDREYFLKYGLEINFQKLDVFYRNKRLIVFDMDSTLIKQECIDELAGLYGVKGEVSKITELAMQGQLDFTQSLKARVSLLKGASVDIIEQVKQKIEFTAGALPLCKCLKVLGYQLAVVSGGFLPLAEYVKETLNLDFAFANQLQVSPDGNYLTGELVGDIVSAERKEEILKMLSGKFNLNLKQVMAVGDGANDLLMMKTAGLGVAFNAKSKVQEEAQVCLNQANLLGVLHLLGYTTHDIKELLSITQQ